MHDVADVGFRKGLLFLALVAVMVAVSLLLLLA
jgi:hypothetical protein